MLAGCDREPTTAPSVPPSSLALAGPASTERAMTTEFPAVRRVELVLRASGSFRPGTPISITARVLAKRAARNVELQLVILDEDPTDSQGAERRTRPLTQWRGTLAVGTGQSVSSTVRFSRPGYYRVLALATSQGDAVPSRSPRDTTILNSSFETLWLLVEEQGGRVTNGYESVMVDSARRHIISANATIPLYGSYGPFRQRRRDGRTSSAASLAPLTSRGGAAKASAAPNPGASMGGYVRYGNYDISNPPPLAPVPGAEVEVTCFGKSNPNVIVYDLSYSFFTSTSPSGGFGVSCSAGYDYVEGYVRLRNADVYVAGPSNAAAGAGFAAYDGELVELRVANDYAARVLIDLRERIPMVFSKMGRSRSRIYSEVSPNDPNFGIFYCHAAGAGGVCPAADMILTNYTRVFREDGLFVSLHEYGHGYHYRAVESWGAYTCNDSDGNGRPEHFWAETDNLSCAFVEGFADWLTMWVGGDRLVTAPYGGDYGIENNVDGYPSGTRTNPPPSGDGVRVEAAVAAFLYDLVDGNSEPDSPSNTAGSAEWFDTAVYPASWILDVMQFCRPGGVVTNLDGFDLLIPCLEGGTNTAFAESQRWSTSWRSFNSIVWERTLAVYDKATIRRLWKYNLYGVLE